MAGVDGAGAARAEKRVVARIATALGDVHAGGARHVLVDDVVDTPRDLDQRQAYRLGEPGQGAARGRDVDRDGAAREVLGVQVAEDEIGVRDGRLRPAEGVACRARLRARAARPDFQETDLVDVRDGAAAGADLDQLDGRDAHRQAAALDEPFLARGLEAVRGERLAPVDERELGGGAAHVEREEVTAAVLAAEEGRGDRPRGGP